MNKGKVAFFIGLSISMFLLVGLAVVKSQVPCDGKKNFQIRGSELPETGINGSSQMIKVFVLPEVNNFQEIYQSFRVVGAKAILWCGIGGSPCDFYVNGNLCLQNVGVQNLYDLSSCINYFHDGINTIKLVGQGNNINGNVGWIFLEARIDSGLCWDNR